MTALATRVYPMRKFGPVQPATLSGPVRSGRGQFGRAIVIEEGSTNLAIDPGFRTALYGATGLTYTTNTQVGGHSGTGLRGVGTGTAFPTVTTHGFGANDATADPYSITFDARVPVNSAWAPQDITNNISLTGGGGTYTATLTEYGSTTSLTGLIADGRTHRYTVTLTNPASRPAWTFGLKEVNGAAYYGYVEMSALQVEARAYPTSYIDWILQTFYNAAGNLLSAASSDFEDGTVGQWSSRNGTATPTNAAVVIYGGSKAMLITPNGTAFAGVQQDYAGLTPGVTYTLSGRFRSAGAARGIFVGVRDGSTDANIAQTSATAPAANNLLVGATFVAPASGIARLVLTTNDATSTAWYADALRLEVGTGSVGYYANGPENASTVTRAPSLLLHNLPDVTLGPFTVTARVRVGTPGATGVKRTIVQFSAGTGGVQPTIDYTGTTLQFTNNVDVSAAASVALVAGDRLAVAGVLAADGKTFTLYYSVNDGPVVSVVSGASATAYSGGSQIAVGHTIAGASHLDGEVEQVLLFTRAVPATSSTATDVADLLLGPQASFEDDEGISLGLLERTGDLFGDNAVVAQSSAGTGRYRRQQRTEQAVPASIIPGVGPEYVLSGAVMTVQVPDLGGPLNVGVGEVIGLDDGQWHTVLGVQRGAAEDLLFVN